MKMKKFLQNGNLSHKKGVYISEPIIFNIGSLLTFYVIRAIINI